jgi:hypothetical protein
MVFIYLLVFGDRISKAWAGLELTILLSQSPECWDYTIVHLMVIFMPDRPLGLRMQWQICCYPAFRWQPCDMIFGHIKW